MAAMGEVGPFFTDRRGKKVPPRRAVAILATRQHGVVCRRQLLALGLGPSAVDRWLAGGALHRMHAGVYAVGHRAIGPHGRWMAAVLACGPDAVLSHASAAALWGLRPTGRAAVDVTAPGRSRHGRAGIAVHRVRRLDPADRAEREAIPVTTVARVLLDLAGVLGPRELERALEAAERLRLLDVGALEATIRRSPGRRLGRLATAIAEEREPPPVRSELERRFLDVCEDAGLPPPAVNAMVEGLEVDAVWRGSRLVVELDGHAFHGTRAAFERDRERDATLQLAGYRVLRLTHRRLGDPEAVAGMLRGLLPSGAQALPRRRR